jgi:hypothetical protein
MAPTHDQVFARSDGSRKIPKEDAEAVACD